MFHVFLFKSSPRGLFPTGIGVLQLSYIFSGFLQIVFACIGAGFLVILLNISFLFLCSHSPIVIRFLHSVSLGVGVSTIRMLLVMLTSIWLINFLCLARFLASPVYIVMGVRQELMNFLNVFICSCSAGLQIWLWSVSMHLLFWILIVLTGHVDLFCCGSFPNSFVFMGGV